MRLYPMNLGQARTRLVCEGAALAAVALIAGCGSTYRPVVTPVTPSGPPAQPTSYAIVVSAPSTTTPGIATVIDYSGDSVLALAPIGVGPVAFSIDEIGGNGYTVNSDGTLSNFPLSSSLQAKQVLYSTLPTGAAPVNLFSPSSGLYAADLLGNVADVFSGFPQALKLSIPVASAPVMIVGPSVSGQRVFALSQNFPVAPPLYTAGIDCNSMPTTVGTNGVADAIELSSLTVSSEIGLDPFNSTNAAGGTENAQCPVFAVETPDNKRLFVLNRGSDTISVINSQDNTLNQCTPFLNQNGQTVSCHPILPLSLTAVSAISAAYTAAGSPVDLPNGTPPNGTTGMVAKAGPVYAEYNQATAQLVVADYDGGTISVIDVSEDEYGNDSQTFGTTYTIPVGTNPAAVTVLADGSRAYTANQNDETISIVQLSSHTVEKTLPTTGHPRTVVSTQNSQFGKVYAASPDSPYLTIIRTDLDIVDTAVLVEGNIVDVRVTTQTGSSGNANTSSRRPGFGQPCYLPGTAAAASLTACRTLP
jgi:DNA-binding beta-propeller fold protein YncE